MTSILVVDDDEMNLKIARVILEQKRYSVKTVSSAQECISILKTKRFDLVLFHIS